MYRFVCLTFHVFSSVVMSEGFNDSRSHVPKWDGNPQSYQRYKDEIRIWRLSENMNVDYSLAARMIGALSGSARRATISLSEDALLARCA